MILIGSAPCRSSIFISTTPRQHTVPNRVIREALLDSDGYWSVTIEARQLFFHLLLLADDLGCISLAPVLLRRRCFDSPPTTQKIDKLLGELVDADLIRRYTSNSDPLAFIPKFRQRLQRIYAKYPIPPESLYYDDKHAKKLFSKIKKDEPDTTVGQPLPNGSPTNESNRRESNLRESKVLGGDSATICQDQNHLDNSTGPRNALQLARSIATKAGST